MENTIITKEVYEMKQPFHKLEQIIHHHLIHSFFKKNLGVNTGKMGTVLLFFHYAHYMNNNLYEEFAEDLLDEICSNINANTAWGICDGLIGIGWGVEYLIHQNYVAGTTDEILLDIDKKIMEKDVRRIEDYSFQSGLEGLSYYVLARLLSPREKGSPFDTTFLSDIENKCIESSKFSGEGMRLLLNYMQGKEIKYPYSKVLDKLIDECELVKEKMSWGAGMKLLENLD